jgi:hypothetical protein
MIGNDGRPFRHHERKLRVHDRLSVQCAILASSGFARAKTILSADEERQTLKSTPIAPTVRRPVRKVRGEWGWCLPTVRR